MAQTRYFRLRDDVGVEGPVLVEGIDPLTGEPIEKPNPREGEMQPLHHTTLRISVPAMTRDGRIFEDVQAVEIAADGAYCTVQKRDGSLARVGLPDTADKVFDSDARILALSTPKLIDGVEQTGLYVEIDAPKSTNKRKEA